jgi:hypothetical protein
MWTVVSFSLPRVTVRKSHRRLPFISHLTGPQCRNAEDTALQSDYVPMSPNDAYHQTRTFSRSAVRKKFHERSSIWKLAVSHVLLRFVCAAFHASVCTVSFMSVTLAAMSSTIQANSLSCAHLFCNRAGWRNTSTQNLF